MNNFIERSLLFIIGLPMLVVLIIITAPYANAGWVAAVVVFSFLGSRESYALFTAGMEENDHGYPFIAILGTVVILSAYGDVIFQPAVSLVPPLLTLALSIILLVTLFSWRSYRMQGSFVLHMAARISALIYPAFFAVFLVMLSGLQASYHLVLLFLVLNFGNDTFAYLAGKFLAKRKRKPLFAVSPNKTLVGFIGGFVGSLLAGSIYLLALPNLLQGPFPAHLLFFFLVALFGNLGDLIESALKRSASLKDSGKLIPGRGGVLDSIDSLLFSAPIFYYSISIFFM